ncbi:immunoglobulin superfamily member 1-like [Cetorhinus maximus]
MSVSGTKPILQEAVVSILLLMVVSLGAQRASLPKPILSLDPPSSVILLGEDYTLVCHFPLTRCNVELYKGFKDRVSAANEVDYTAAFKVTAALPSKGKNSYTCKYQKFYERNLTWAYSPISDPVQFNVADELPKPSVSVEPASGVLSVGDQVHINCTTCYPSRLSRLYRERDGLIIDTQNTSESVRTVIFTIKELEPMDGGAYSCNVVKTVLGKVYVSPRSDFVEFNVTDELPRATISVQPPFGVVSSGTLIRLTCTGAILNSGGLFYFYRDGETRGTIHVSGSVPSASFIVNDLISAGKWSFNCGYSRRVRQTAYYSPPSEAVQVTVTDFNGTSDSFPNVLCVGAIVLLWIISILGTE